MTAFKCIVRSVWNFTYSKAKASMLVSTLVSKNGRLDVLLHIWAVSVSGSITETSVLSGGIRPRVFRSKGKMPTNSNVAFQ